MDKYNREEIKRANFAREERILREIGVSEEDINFLEHMKYKDIISEKWN